MFKNIYYNNYSNNIHLWENINGKTVKTSFKPEIEYYVMDKDNDSNIKDIFGNSFKLRKSKNRKSMKEFIENSRVKTCEANVAEDIKCLQKRYKNENFNIDINDFQIANIDIEIESGDDFPDPDLALYPINLITVKYSNGNEIITYGNREYTGDKNIKNYCFIPDEKKMLEKFILDFKRRKVDIITGWYIDTFDIPYIVNRTLELNINETLSPLNRYDELNIKDGYGNYKKSYSIPGISILDGAKNYKRFTFKNQVSYSLNNIGMVELGEGKLDLDGQINNIYKTNWNLFVEYNIQDVLLVDKIENKKKFIELIINFCYEALIPFEKIYPSMTLITGYVLKYLHQKNLVLPDVPNSHKQSIPGAYTMAKKGLFNNVMSFDVESMYPHMIMMYNISPETLVYNPKPEEIKNLIKTPLSKLYECDTPSGKFSVKGIYYKKDKKGILPEIVEKIFKERKHLKTKKKIAEGVESNLSLEEISNNTYLSLDLVKNLSKEIEKEGYTSEYYGSQEQIRKILINSIYGVLANRYFSFYNIKNAMAITIGGRHCIQFLSRKINEYMKKYWHKVATKIFPEYNNINVPEIKNDVVILIDTDSNYICLDEVIKGFGIEFENDEEYRKWCNNFDKKFLTPFFNKILDKYVEPFGVPQLINFKRECIITKKLITAKKKYVDLIIDKEGKIFDPPKLGVKGVEIIRTNTPKFCRNKLQTIVRNIMEKNDKNEIVSDLNDVYDGFNISPIEDISKVSSVNNYSKYSEDLAECVNDNRLIYPKHTPQHVKAALGYNYLIKKYNLKLQPVGNGSKIKYIKVNKRNELDTDIIGYIGKYPEEFKKIFKIDREEQWNKTFVKVVQRFYEILKWGEVQLDTVDLDFIEF